jgi:hypothetical protein
MVDAEEKVEYCTTEEKTSEKLKDYAEGLAKEASNFSLSFLPEETKKHVVKLEKEALLALKSVIEKGEKVLQKEEK